MNTITPFLWFDANAEEAVNFYLEVFKDAKISELSRYGEGGPGAAGSVMVIKFKLLGQEFLALNGGPYNKFNDAISFTISCETQEEVDYYWDKLTAGGEEVQCGWLRDKFGLSWQVTPTVLTELLSDPDPDRSRRAMEAMMKMVKLDIGALKAAANSE